MPPNPAVEPLAVSFLNSFFWYLYELDIIVEQTIVRRPSRVDPSARLTGRAVPGDGARSGVRWHSWAEMTALRPHKIKTREKARCRDHTVCWEVGETDLTSEIE